MSRSFHTAWTWSGFRRGSRPQRRVAQRCIWLLFAALAAPAADATVTFDEIMRWGGDPISAVDARGDLACIASGDLVMTFNIAAPDQPLLLGMAPILSDYCTGIAVGGRYAYIGENAGTLRVLDLADPANPVQVYVLDLGQPIGDIKLVGERAYIASTGLIILDLSEPAWPAVMGSTPFELTNAVDADGDYACLTTSDNGMGIVNVANPYAPQLVGWCADTPDYATAVGVYGSFAYVCSQSFDGLSIIDFTSPENPVLIGTVPSCYPYDVEIVGQLMFTDGSPALAVFDLSNPAQPIRIGVLYGGET
jgi:hypothetical protein